MGRKSIREQTIESGVRTLHERGYANAGVREITAAAGVPQGSFINHFGSKEAFAVMVLERYAERTHQVMDATLLDPESTPVERLRGYFDAITRMLEDSGWRFGCLVGNMSLEAPEHSEPIRESLVAIMESFTERFAEAVRAGQASGDFRDDVEATELAAFLLSAWQGSMLRMKVDRTGAAIERFFKIVFASIVARNA